MNKSVFYILWILLLCSCDLLKKKEDKPVAEDKETPLARVHDKYLYYEDIEGVSGKHISKEDSADIVNRYINSWIQSQLILTKAESTVDENNPELKKEIEDCKNTLIVHEFEKEYLIKQLDTTFTEKELRSYYDANHGTFELKQNIFKGIFVKVPKDAPDLDKVKSLVYSGKPKDIKELKSYCVRFASHYILEDTVWINFDELTKNSPLSSIQDRADFLEKNRQAEISDNKFIYFLKIRDYKISKQISPFEFVEGQIKKTLLNRRKIKLINDLKVSIYQEAQKNNEFEIIGKKK